ncbi:MAG: hypothetical protein ACJ79X_02310, partial [Gemmatimonadaceae bacterium]
MPKTGTTAPPRKSASKGSSTPSAKAGGNSSKPSAPAAAPSGSALEIKDTRTSKSYSVPIA